MADRVLTQSRLKELLHYDPETGEWRRLRSRQRPDTEGKRPGYISKGGRHCISVDGVEYLAHRLAYLYMTGEWPEIYVDHKNGVGHDNVWENLRPASQSQNIANSRLSKANTSGYKGVVWNPRKKKWTAQICFNGKNMVLGRFHDPREAHEAYLKKAQELFGELRDDYGKSMRVTRYCSTLVARSRGLP
jgi:hypothetical protein